MCFEGYWFTTVYCQLPSPALFMTSYTCMNKLLTKSIVVILCILVMYDVWPASQYPVWTSKPCIPAKLANSKDSIVLIMHDK